MNNFMTAEMLAKELMKYGDLPIKLRIEDSYSPLLIHGAQILFPDAVDICSKRAETPDFGSIVVCRITIRFDDNA